MAAFRIEELYWLYSDTLAEKETTDSELFPWLNVLPSTVHRTISLLSTSHHCQFVIVSLCQKFKKYILLINVYVFCLHCVLRCLKAHGESGFQTEDSPNHGDQMGLGHCNLCVAMILRPNIIGTFSWSTLGKSKASPHRLQVSERLYLPLSEVLVFC